MIPYLVKNHRPGDIELLPVKGTMKKLIFLQLTVQTASCFFMQQDIVCVFLLE